MIHVKTSEGLDTDLTVQTLSIHGGGMVTLVVSDRSDNNQIMVYDDEIDNLIAALQELKGELK